MSAKTAYDLIQSLDGFEPQTFLL